MKRLLSLILGLALLTAGEAWGALSASTIWEIQQAATAANVNGCGYNPANATPGTDRSQTAAAYDYGTDLATADGDVDGCVITSATHNFVDDDEGNIIHITAGTGWTAGWYEVVSTAGNAATLDRACGTDGAKTDGTWYLGGACSLGNALDDDVFELAGAVWYIKYDAAHATITIGEDVNIGSNDGVAVLPKYIVGYATTRTTANIDSDASELREILDLGASYTLTVGDYYFVRNLRMTGTDTGVMSSGANVSLYNVKVTNTSETADRTALTLSAGGLCRRCELSSTLGLALSSAANTRVIGSYIHDSNIGVTTAGASFMLIDSVVDTCTTTAVNLGATYDHTGIYGSTLYGVNSGDTGIVAPDNERFVLINTTLSNFATAINFTTATLSNMYDYNNYDTDTTTNVTQGPHDVNVSPSFTGAAGADFSLTGTELADKAFPGPLPGAATDSTRYIGAWQKNATAGGGGGAWGF